MVYPYLLDLCIGSDQNKKDVKRFKLYLNDIPVLQYLLESETPAKGLQKAMFEFENHGVPKDQAQWVIAQCVYALRISTKMDLGVHRIPLNNHTATKTASTKPKVSPQGPPIAVATPSVKTNASVTNPQSVASKPNPQTTTPAVPNPTPQVVVAAPPQTKAPQQPHSPSSSSRKRKRTWSDVANAVWEWFLYDRHWLLGLIVWTLLVSASILLPIFFFEQPFSISIITMILAVLGIADCTYLLIFYVVDEEMGALTLGIPILLFLGIVVLFFVSPASHYLVYSTFGVLLVFGLVAWFNNFLIEDLWKNPHLTVMISSILVLVLAYFLFVGVFQWIAVLQITLVLWVLLASSGLMIARFIEEDGRLDWLWDRLFSVILLVVAFFSAIIVTTNDTSEEIGFLLPMLSGVSIYCAFYHVSHMILSLIASKGGLRQGIITILTLLIGLLFVYSSGPEPNAVGLLYFFIISFIIHIFIHVWILFQQDYSGWAGFHFYLGLFLVGATLIFTVFPEFYATIFEWIS